MIIKIEHYPARMEFTTDVPLPEFQYGCAVRTGILADTMRATRFKSPVHAIEDFIVEDVTKTIDGEQWEIGS